MMTILCYILIFLPVTIALVAALYTITKKGETEGIADYGYIEEEENSSEQ